MASAYLAKYGATVIDQGYTICFIRPGEKRPYGKNWETRKHSVEAIEAALADGQDFGVGIKTKRTPGVDIDCYDPGIVAKMITFTTDLLGESLERVGMAPKTLLVYRAKTPFPKTQSKVFIDDEGRPVKLEVLADGQQFVAFHVHPDTEKPYRWKDKKHPANTPRADLPEITQDDALAIVEQFESYARAAGWPEKATASRLAKTSGGKYDNDDPFISDKSKIELTTEDLRAKLQMVPNPADYDQWFHVGMALHHQFSGSDEGLLLWHEWSADAPNYSEDALDEKWPTFEIEGKKREPLTARYILKQAQAEEERIASDELDEVKEQIAEASNLVEIRKAADRIKRTAFDTIQRESLAQLIQGQIKRRENTNMSITAVRAMLRYENPDNSSMPPWLAHFVYCQHDETFYSTRTRQVLSTKAFDQSFGRYMMTKKDRLEGRSAPEHTASHVALYRYQIPIVANRMYLPNEGEIFTIDGLDYVNSYSDAFKLELPEQYNRKQKRAVQAVLRHLDHLFSNDRDRKLLLSWLCYIVQTDKRPNWAPVIQGVQGDGKTFFHLLMGAVLGGANVQVILGEALAEKYTGWAEGSQFCFVEEVRLHGPDRFKVINKLKPFITNVMAPIRRMNTDSYDVINTVAYMLTTNHKDGVPVDENDTRYFPMFSRWQRKKVIDAHNAAHPRYYDELHAALEEPEALRKFMMEYELHPEFDPKKRAPESAARAEMVYLNANDESEGFEMALEVSTDPLFSEPLLDTSHIDAGVENFNVSVPYGRALKMMLSEAGFSYLGRFRINSEMMRLWSRDPDRFREAGGAVNTMKVRRYLDNGGDVI